MFLMLTIVHELTLHVVCHLDKEGGLRYRLNEKSHKKNAQRMCLTGPVLKKIITMTEYKLPMNLIVSLGQFKNLVTV